MSSFAHLHLHSQYSFLDATIRLGDLMKAVKAGGMESVALTDHGHMHGLVDFAEQAKKNNVKPIFGCEVYVAPSGREDRSKREAHHMVLLAKNDTGLANLRYLVSEGYLSGFHYHPRIDYDLLKNHTEGLIGLTACLGGVVNRPLREKGPDAAREVAKMLKGMFAPDHFFLELQRNGYKELAEVNPVLQQFSRDLDIPLVATNDCHYMKPEQQQARNILLCIRNNMTLAEFRHDADEMYFRTADEMAALFSDVPEAIENAARIADMIERMKLDRKPTLPKYPLPDNYADPEDYLRHLAREGLEKRFAELGPGIDHDRYKDRLELELAMIAKMGFPGYFLIVWDFINWAKNHGIPVGPGRGSGAGSLVAYAVRITDIDPIRYDLLFERFLNPERVSMPDIDVDFCMDRRDEVIKYMFDRYGHDRVGQITTFASLKAKGAVRDVARVKGLSFADGDAISRLLPDATGKTVTLRPPPEGGQTDESIVHAYEVEPRLKQLYDRDANAREVLDMALAIEGCMRQTGLHAAGVVIAEGPLHDSVPVYRSKTGELVSQFAMKEVEKAGLVKFDFLGLKTLTVINTCVNLINDRRAKAEQFDISRIPTDDAPTFAMIARGDTTGVFQLEGRGITEMMKKLKPDCFEDIIAAVALYRPGPLDSGMAEQYINRKNGREAVDSLHPLIDSVLGETYGVMVYQEQVMRVAQELSGFTLGDADLLRRAMGKKDAQAMEKLRGEFVDGAAKNGVPTERSGDIFDMIQKFARYGFNKSHSAAYALVSYQTAYLKCHFATEFYAALLTNETKDPDKVVRYLSQARSEGIKVFPPDVNTAAMHYTVSVSETERVIRFGLSALRGVGEGAVEAILTERTANGPFRSLFDFCARVDSRKVNRKVLDTLVKCGAFDFTGHWRSTLMASLDNAQTYGARRQKERDSNQVSLFGALMGGGGGGGKGKGAKGGAAAESDPGLVTDERYVETEPWSLRETLGYERETMGLFVSGHPLDQYRDDLKKLVSHTAIDLQEDARDRMAVVLAGVISESETRLSKKGSRYMQGKLEDLTGATPFMVTLGENRRSKPNALLPPGLKEQSVEQLEDLLNSGRPVLMAGAMRVETDGENRTIKLSVSDVHSLADVRKLRARRVMLKLNAAGLTADFAPLLKATLEKFPGECGAIVQVVVPGQGEVALKLGNVGVDADEALIEALERVVPREAELSFKCV
jgi:DNA polymerase III subunit alpha